MNISGLRRKAYYLQDTRTGIGLIVGATAGIGVSHLNFQIQQHVFAAILGGAIGALVGGIGLMAMAAFTSEARPDSLPDGRVTDDWSLRDFNKLQIWRGRVARRNREATRVGVMVGATLGTIIGSTLAI